MTPVDWLQHCAEGITVLGAVGVGIGKARKLVERFEAGVAKLGRIDEIEVRLDAHIAQPPDEAHAQQPPPVRAPQPSKPGLA